MTKRVLIVQPIHQSGVDLLREEVEVRQASDPSEDTVCREIKGVHGVIVRTAPFTERIIAAADALQVIGRHGVGVDNIPVDAASKRGILIVNTPHANTVSVAEHTLGFMLALAKRTLVCDRAMRTENFAIREEFAAVDLEGKTVGIVGLGRIGSAVAEKCRSAFGMPVLAYDPYLGEEKIREFGAEPSGRLEDLLARADFIAIHVPLNEETEGLIGERELKLMKPSAFLINMARGGIVDENALARSLEQGWIAGAAADVFSEEPPSPDNPLLKVDNIVLSPHMSSLTRECTIRMATGAAQGVLDVLQGRTPKHIVNREILEGRDR